MKLWEKSQLFRDIHNAILDDGYLWIVVHGPPRSSKTTLALWAAFAVYEDWDLALKATVFNLPSVIHRMQNGIPCRWPTINGLHMRVPLIIYDDFGVHSNKADTQHSTAWDIFKGSFDALGTELGVLMATMVDAAEATCQLQNKYNAELTVNTKGHYKYDKVLWLQDYRGFRNKMRKDWIENGTYDPIPKDVYVEYDEMRKELTREAFVRIQDALSVDFMSNTMRVIRQVDIDILQLIVDRGPITHDVAKEKLGEEYKNTITRCKARNLIIPTCLGGKFYKYDISSLGLDVLETWREEDGKCEQKATHRT